MTFTYDAGALTTPLAQVRLEIGDTVSSSPLFADEEINVKLAVRSNNVLLAAADLCDILAVRFAREFDFDANEAKSFKRSQKSAAYRALARELRARAQVEATGGLAVVVVTKVDAIADDLSSRDGGSLLARTGRTRHGYYDGDLPS